MNTVKTVELILGIIGLVSLFIYFRKSGMKLGVARFARLFVGLVFIYSGFVKGVDPLGTVYRLEDYFYAFGTEWALPFSFAMSIFLCAFEFVLGFMLLLNIRIKLTAWLTLITMVVFTILTFFDALYETVPDCGCFGDALIITNWETFYKNIVIMFFVIIIMAHRRRYIPIFSTIGEAVTFTVIAGSFVWFEFYNVNHLPVIDFTDWKVGNRLYAEDPKPIECYLMYRNKETGEMMEYLSPNFPFSDTAWMARWEFVDQRIIDPNPSVNFMLEDRYGDDVTDSYIRNPDYMFLLISYDLRKANAKVFGQVNSLFNSAMEEGYSFIVATSLLNFDEIEDMRSILEIDEHIEFFLSDDIELKTAIRANPGLILLKNGEILAKWHYNDFPDYNAIKNRYMN